jgi:acyl-CoA thioesterase I
MTTFVFAGDSVTDCGRTFHGPDVAAGHLGDGWVRIVAALLGHRRPGRDRFLNAGVAGDLVVDLARRWERDVAAHDPEVLTVLIGVNDTWWDPPTATTDLEAAYRSLLDRVPSSVDTLVLADPFAVPVGDGKALVDALTPTVEVVSRLAEERGAVHLPLAALFAEACERTRPGWWAPDGIHPSAAGHGLIADGWLGAVAPDFP